MDDQKTDHDPQPQPTAPDLSEAAIAKAFDQGDNSFSGLSFTKKVAIVGGAPSRLYAPWKETDWKIWRLAQQHEKDFRADILFELHEWDEVERMTKEENAKYGDYAGFLKSKDRPMLYVSHNLPIGDAAKMAKRLPVDQMIEKWGDEFLTSSMAWMMAQALDEGFTHIGLFGVDCMATEEYREQLSGIKHFMAVARLMGVSITLPPGSNLMRPGKVYPFAAESEGNKHVRLEISRLNALANEARSAAARCRAEADALDLRAQHALGQVEGHEHLLRNNWIV